VGYPAPTPAGPQSPGPIATQPRPQPAVIRPAPAPVSAPTTEMADAGQPPLPEPAPAAPPREYEVLGQRYTLLPSAEDYIEVGVASWYGGEFAGRPTSNGERYNPEGLTAAHRTLPMSTWVEVRNLQNGRSVVLRVNDRGPFSDTHERIIDVSQVAARILGLLGPGTAPVEVRAVPGPSGVSFGHF
ncbi:MAG TPA: septal ring lytic transglycosylase RlpA family protein, partial [Longimicrobiales bacterium]|nr:septal ring lytic transglycosylase RlpA family protein [Longimicrobiales bacterium]